MGQRGRRREQRLGTDVGAVPVQSGGERAGPAEVGDHGVGVWVVSPIRGSCGSRRPRSIPRRCRRTGTGACTTTSGAARYRRRGTRLGAPRTAPRGVRRGRARTTRGPRDRCAPVVAHYVRALDADCVHDADHVADQGRERVLLDGLGHERLAHAALVRRDGAEPRRVQRGELGSPEAMRVGPTVQQHDGRTVARDVHLEPGSVHVELHRCVLCRLVRPAADRSPPREPGARHASAQGTVRPRLPAPGPVRRPRGARARRRRGPAARRSPGSRATARGPWPSHSRGPDRVATPDRRACRGHRRSPRRSQRGGGDRRPSVSRK